MRRIDVPRGCGRSLSGLFRSACRPTRYQMDLMLDIRPRTNLCKPAPDIVESDAHDVASLEGAPIGMIRGAIAEEAAIAETKVFDQVGLGAAAGAMGSAGVCERFAARDVALGVSANETLVALADNVGLASSVGVQRRQAVKASTMRLA